MGLFLGGHLEATPSSDPFTSSVFHFPEPEVIVRISPMISGPKNLPFDLHGISVRIQPNDNAADITDLVYVKEPVYIFFEEELTMRPAEGRFEEEFAL